MVLATPPAATTHPDTRPSNRDKLSQRRFQAGGAGIRQRQYAPGETTEDPARHADNRRQLDWPEEEADDPEKTSLDAGNAAGDDSSPKIGICVSGGGIRATAFALGALSALEDASVEDDRPATESARYLAAVSGGAWAATVWTLQKARHPRKGQPKRSLPD